MHRRLVGRVHRRHDPEHGLDGEGRLRVDEHEAVAEQLREPRLLAALPRHRGRKSVDHADRCAVPAAIGERGEALEVTEQDRHLGEVDGQLGCRSGLGTPHRHLRGLALDPAPMYAGQERVRRGEQPIKRASGGCGPTILGRLDASQQRLRNREPLLRRGLGDPGQQAPVQARNLNGRSERPDITAPPELSQRMPLVLSEHRLRGPRGREAQRRHELLHACHRHSSAPLDRLGRHRPVDRAAQRECLEERSCEVAALPCLLARSRRDAKAGKHVLQELCLGARRLTQQIDRRACRLVGGINPNGRHGYLGSGEVGDPAAM
jgi:hypothetical protein